MREKKLVPKKPQSRGERDFRERRRQADWVINAASAFSVISWLVAFFVITVIQMASPEKRNFLSEVSIGADPRTNWDTTLLPFAYYLLILSVLASLAAFVFNSMRMRRKTDRYRKSIIIIGTINVIGFVAFSIYLFF